MCRQRIERREKNGRTNTRSHICNTSHKNDLHFQCCIPCSLLNQNSTWSAISLSDSQIGLSFDRPTDRSSIGHHDPISARSVGPFYSGPQSYDGGDLGSDHVPPSIRTKERMNENRSAATNRRLLQPPLSLTPIRSTPGRIINCDSKTDKCMHSRRSPPSLLLGKTEAALDRCVTDERREREREGAVKNAKEGNKCNTAAR